MKTLSVSCLPGLAAILFSTVSSHALDFTPQETWRGLEGVRIPVVMFSDPTGRIRYQPPGDWNFSGSGAMFSLYPPKLTGAVMKMLILRHAPGAPEIVNIPSADLAKWCQNYLASDAQEVKLQQENPSPFLLGGRESREFVFEYLSSGQRYQTSIAVLDWNDQEHFAVVITALAPDFKAVHDTGNSSLFSWSLRKTEAPKGTPAPGPTPIQAPNR